MRTRSRYISITEAEAGMELAAPVRIVNQGLLCMTLPKGHLLCNTSLKQLRAHHADFLFVTEIDKRNNMRIASDTAQAAHRVMSIFEGADLSDPTMAALFDQVLIYRSA